VGFEFELCEYEYEYDCLYDLPGDLAWKT